MIRSRRVNFSNLLLNCEYIDHEDSTINNQQILILRSVKRKNLSNIIVIITNVWHYKLILITFSKAAKANLYFYI